MAKAVMKKLIVAILLTLTLYCSSGYAVEEIDHQRQEVIREVEELMKRNHYEKETLMTVPVTKQDENG
ncbi:MAG: hypothetical protein Q7J31_19205 [Syntrophales bacterium]|nr:hypothetical protein [Syntrophales bacterium]